MKKSILFACFLIVLVGLKTLDCKEHSFVELSVEIKAYNKTVELISMSSEDALTFGSNAITQIKIPKDSVGYTQLLKVTGAAAYNLGKYDLALSLFQKAEILTKELNLYKFHADCLSNIANVFYMINQYDKSIFYNKQSIIFYELAKNEEGAIAMCYNSLGVTYSDMNYPDSAFFYFTKALDNLEKDNFDRANVYDNLGELSETAGDYDSALEYYRKAEALQKDNNDLDGLSWTYNHLGMVHTSIGLHNKARAYLRKANLYAKQLGLMFRQKSITNSLINSFLEEGQIDSVSFYFSKYKVLNDSLNAEQLNKNIQEIEAKYQVEKKDASLAIAKEKTARLTAENKNNKIYLFGASILVLLLVVGLLAGNRTYRQKRKITSMKLELKNSEFKELLIKQEAESLDAMLKGQEEERERIAKDLHDRLGGTLAALRLGIRRDENKVEKEELDMLDEAIAEVRSIAHNLSSGIVKKSGLRLALFELKKMIERSEEIKFEAFIQSDLSAIAYETSLELYRIIQELTNNTIKHANATKISIQAMNTELNFNLIYEDNGVGFSHSELEEGMGMRNMRARAEKIKGKFNIDSSPGRGTIAIIEIENQI